MRSNAFSRFSTPGRTSPPAHRRRLASGGLLLGALLLVPASPAMAFPNPAPVALGTAGAFTVLAGSTVTNTGATVVSADTGIGGNLGVSPGTAVTGFPPGVVLPPGEIHSADATASDAQTAAGTASVDAAGRAPNVTFDPVFDIGGQTFTAGVYKAPSSLALTGTVTLDGAANPDSVFIFQVGSTLTTATSSVVLLTNGAQPCNVFWQVGSSATLGTGSLFSGTILAAASISVSDSVGVEGRLLAGTGAVTLINDRIHTPACAPQSGVPLAPVLGRFGTVAPVAALVAGAAAVLVARRRQRPVLAAR